MRKEEVDHTSWKSLKEFLEKKHNDEKSLQPIKIKKHDTWVPMDLSAFGPEGANGGGATGGE